MEQLNKDLHTKTTEKQHSFLRDKAHRDNTSMGQLIRYILDKYIEFEGKK